MIDNASPQTIDLVVVLAANLANLLIIGIFLSRPAGLKRLERALGVIFIALALPVGAAVALNALKGREWWTIVLPVPLVLFCSLSLLWDYILKLEFRNTALLRPYLGLFYVALIAIMGYAFGASETYGFITLGTYLLGLVATGYSYSKVGHGVAREGML